MLIMQIQNLKNLNVTLVLDSNIDHNAIANKHIFDVVSENDEKVDHVVMDGPNLKIFQFPKLEYELIIDPKRLVVNDKSGNDFSSSKIVSRVIKLHEVVGGEVKSYGFNFDYLVTDENFSANNLLSEKLSLFKDAREIGASLRFDEDGADVGLEVKPIKGKTGEFIAHINVHYSKSFVVKEDVITKEFLIAEKIAQNLVSKI